MYRHSAYRGTHVRLTPLLSVFYGVRVASKLIAHLWAGFGGYLLCSPHLSGHHFHARGGSRPSTYTLTGEESVMLTKQDMGTDARISWILTQPRILIFGIIIRVIATDDGGQRGGFNTNTVVKRHLLVNCTMK